jgi:hypothetical protein
MSERIVRVTRDNSGQVTIQLVGWTDKELKRLAGSLLLDRETDKIGRLLSKRLEGGNR